MVAITIELISGARNGLSEMPPSNRRLVVVEGEVLRDEALQNVVPR